MKDVYKTLSGRRFDLTLLLPNEREFLKTIFKLYETRPDWDEFSKKWLSLYKEVKNNHTSPAKPAVYRICQDLAARLGIFQGLVSLPDYRDQIADLIEEKFQSRYKFCERSGIDEGHLSRVLAGKKHFAPETLFKIFDVLEVHIELTPQDEIINYQNRNILLLNNSPIERLNDLEREVLRLDPPNDESRQKLKEVLDERFALALEIADDTRLRAMMSGISLSQSNVEVSNKEDSVQEQNFIIDENDLLGKCSKVNGVMASYLKENSKVVNESCGSTDLHLEYGSYLSDCAYLFFPEERIDFPLVEAVDKSLGSSPAIVAAGIPGYGWVALENSSISSIQKIIKPFVEGYGAKFFPTQYEFEKFIKSDQDYSLQTHENSQALNQWIEQYPIVRIQFDRSKEPKSPLYQMARQSNLSFSVLHACLIEHHFCDCLVADSYGRPIKDETKLKFLTYRNFYKRFGVSNIYLVHSWMDFRTKGISDDIRNIVRRTLIKHHMTNKEYPKVVEDTVKQIVKNYPAFFSGYRDEVSNQVEKQTNNAKKNLCFVVGAKL